MSVSFAKRKPEQFDLGPPGDESWCDSNVLVAFDITKSRDSSHVAEEIRNRVYSYQSDNFVGEAIPAI